MSSVNEATVQLGRLESRGVLLGLDATQTGLLAVALVVAITAEYARGATGLIVTAPAWAGMAALCLISTGGRPVVEWLPLLSRWIGRSRLGSNSFRAETSVVTRQALSLPGLRPRLAVLRGPATGAALMHDPQDSTITAALVVNGGGFILDAPGAQATSVAGWGRLLAGLCQQRAAVRLQVLVRSGPGHVDAVQSWWRQQLSTEASWAARVLAEVVADSRVGATRHQCYLSLVVRTPQAGKRGTRPEALAMVEQHLRSLESAARSAGLDVRGWVKPSDLAHSLRSTYDPEGARVCRTDAQEPLLLGPVAMEESWSSIRTDSAHHAVYWVQEWPRSEVHVGFLQPLILAPGTHRALSITAEPIPPAKALRDIRRAKAELIADAAQRNRIGQVEDEATRAEAADLSRREQELTSGHGDLRFVGLITVTARTADELHAACAATEAAAAQAMCEIRRLVGRQAAALVAAALPLARGVT